MFVYLGSQIVDNTEGLRALGNMPCSKVQGRCEVCQLDVEVPVKV